MSLCKRGSETILDGCRNAIAVASSRTPESTPQRSMCISLPRV
jgi:hypothetical protein